MQMQWPTGLLSTVGASPYAPATLVHVCAARYKSAKGLSDVEYRSEGVVINKYTLSQSHHWSHSSETAEPITVKHDNNGSTNGELLQEIILLSGRFRCEPSAPQICSHGHFKNKTWNSTFANKTVGKEVMVHRTDETSILWFQWASFTYFIYS